MYIVHIYIYIHMYIYIYDNTLPYYYHTIKKRKTQVLALEFSTCSFSHPQTRGPFQNLSRISLRNPRKAWTRWLFSQGSHGPFRSMIHIMIYTKNMDFPDCYVKLPEAIDCALFICMCYSYLRSEATCAGDEVAPKVHFLGHFGVASLAGLKAWHRDLLKHYLPVIKRGKNSSINCGLYRKIIEIYLQMMDCPMPCLMTSKS